MKIIIKESEAKKGFRLVLPYHLLINLAIRKSWFRMGLKYGTKDSHNSHGKDSQNFHGKDRQDTQSKAMENEKILAFVEALDFEELREALHGLSIKSGLVLVEVHSSDGAHIKIET